MDLLWKENKENKSIIKKFIDYNDYYTRAYFILKKENTITVDYKY